MTELVVEITRENAQQMLIEESRHRAVLIDFWAEWCSPCKMLMPILDKLVREYDGQVMLAKVDCDRLQPIAEQFGVRSLPTVILMKDGQPVDGFVGAQTESAVRAMLERHLPKPWDNTIAQAQELLAAGDAPAALPLARSAYEDSGQRADIAKVYADTLIELNRLDDAQSVIDAIPMVEHDSDYERLLSELQLKRQAADTPEIQALLEAYQRAPDDMDIGYQLAVQFSQSGRTREALDILVEIVRREREFRDGEARRTLLDIIRSLGKGDPLAAEYQRKLFALMY
ncbi:MAG TPA: thioredoxin [Pseudomonadales bacterium]|nr:thioredoxin [Pseudomonadales bacterium]HND13880.1 thioredoxin [Pseudomonadales bacterium]